MEICQGEPGNCAVHGHCPREEREDSDQADDRASPRVSIPPAPWAFDDNFLLGLRVPFLFSETSKEKEA